MMKLTCKDMDPTSACNFVATGDSAPEVAGKMLAHAKIEHADALKGKSDADMMKKMQSKVHA